MTARLKRCLEAGDVLALFPLLKDWPQGELAALVEDVEAYSNYLHDRIDQAFQEVAFRPENFLLPVRAKAIDEAVKQKRLEVLAVCSEIMSVAMYYLRAARPAPADEAAKPEGTL